MDSPGLTGCSPQAHPMSHFPGETAPKPGPGEWIRYRCTCQPRGFTTAFRLGGQGPLRCAKCLQSGNLSYVLCSKRRTPAEREAMRKANLAKLGRDR